MGGLSGAAYMAVPWRVDSGRFTRFTHHPLATWKTTEVQQKILELSQLPSTATAAGDYGNVRYLALLGLGFSGVSTSKGG